MFVRSGGSCLLFMFFRWRQNPELDVDFGMIIDVLFDGLT